jgi:hypothetical protein
LLKTSGFIGFFSVVNICFTPKTTLKYEISVSLNACALTTTNNLLLDISALSVENTYLRKLGLQNLPIICSRLTASIIQLSLNFKKRKYLTFIHLLALPKVRFLAVTLEGCFM